MEKETTGLNLDDLALYRRYDPAGMFQHLEETPVRCQRAWQLAEKFKLPDDYARVNKVVILGMGGSAISGELLVSLSSPRARLPIIVHRDYELPGFVDKDTLVIASSYSGNTEETLFAFQQSFKTRAKKLAITTGGLLNEMARANGVPTFTFDYPTPPRTALPYSYLPLIVILLKLGIISIKLPDVSATVAVLKSLSRQIGVSTPSQKNPAKQLALKLYGRLPVIYGAGITTGVAHRWKTQINENAKAWAFYEVFPELNHNAVAGYRFPAELATKFTVVMLGSPLLSIPIKRRYQITTELLKKARVSYLQVELEGSGPLSQVLSLVLLGDYLSCYLAMLYRTDPTPVKAIDYLKEQLTQNYEATSS